METRNPLGTILVVDDNRLILDIVVAILKTQDYLVVAATSGAMALEVAANQSVDMLLSDVQMPEMPGPELAKRLQRQQPGLPVLLMSGEAVSEDFKARGWGFLEKPFSPNILVRAIRQILHSPTRTEREMANMNLEMHAS